MSKTKEKFSVNDKVYMRSPFGIYTGIVKDVNKEQVTILSSSPSGSGSMLATYELEDIEWFKK